MNFRRSTLVETAQPVNDFFNESVEPFFGALFIQDGISGDDDYDGNCVGKRDGRVNSVSGGTSRSGGLRRLVFPVQRPLFLPTTGPDLSTTPLTIDQKPPSNG